MIGAIIWHLLATERINSTHKPRLGPVFMQEPVPPEVQGLRTVAVEHNPPESQARIAIGCIAVIDVDTFRLVKQVSLHC